MHEIRLELARDHDFPQGSSRHGYVLRAPLDGEGRLDPAAWRAHAPQCTVRRFWSGEDDEQGRLVHGRHGWIFTYGGDEEDEPLFRLGEHRLKPGEYLSITEHDGVQRTFRVVRVTQLAQ
jgi:hypothetical protein